MNTRLQLALFTLSRPQVIRVFLIVLSLITLLLASTPVAYAGGCPGSGGTGCGG